MSVKATGLQRSRSDAGRDNAEHRKPPSGLVKPSAGGSFGYKKPPTTGTATVLTAGGATITSGSATVGKTPKSSGIPIKPVPGGGGRKNSLDASGSEQGFLAPNARGSIQYRSLPRPAKSSAMSLTGRPSSRPVSGSIDASLLTLKPVPALPNTMPTRGKEGGSLKAASRSSTTGPVNQTDREKEKERAKAKADLEISCLKAENQGESCGETVEKIHRVRRTSTSKYPELSSPTSTPRYDTCRNTFLKIYIYVSNVCLLNYKLLLLLINYILFYNISTVLCDIMSQTLSISLCPPVHAVMWRRSADEVGGLSASKRSAAK